jgi:hypothetical protein
MTKYTPSIVHTLNKFIYKKMYIVCISPTYLESQENYRRSWLRLTKFFSMNTKSKKLTKEPAFQKDRRGVRGRGGGKMGGGVRGGGNHQPKKNCVMRIILWTGEPLTLTDLLWNLGKTNVRKPDQWKYLACVSGIINSERLTLIHLQTLYPWYCRSTNIMCSEL